MHDTPDSDDCAYDDGPTEFVCDDSRDGVLTMFSDLDVDTRNTSDIERGRLFFFGIVNL